MCAGISFNLSEIDQKEIDLFFTVPEIKKSMTVVELNMGRAKKAVELLNVFYWQKKPCLPVIQDDKVRLYAWGNRDDKELKLPKTGWCRAESLQQGKWDGLKPQQVHLPAVRGYEKKVWFNTPKGLAGVLVEYQGEKRVYMLTQPSNDFYKQLTGHDRMPVGEIV